MTRITTITATVAFGLLLALFASALGAAVMGVSRGHDLDALLARAGETVDLGAHDAVVLLESRTVDLSEPGTRRTTVHRVVRIATSLAIRRHADLRIPRDGDTSTLNVLLLRTWRDGRWWPSESGISETAVVETLPRAAATADDYTGMRETMLLHDGVELPCVIETAWEIAERIDPGAGSDGRFIFRQSDPAVVAELELVLPAGAEPQFAGANGAPSPSRDTGENGETILRWEMTALAPLGAHPAGDPARWVPAVSWSTWRDWPALGLAISTAVDAAAADLGFALADTVTALTRHEPSDAARARRVAAFIDETVRPVLSDASCWRAAPRPARRTWETAYGHALDRLVLAAGLFRAAGLVADPLLVGTSPGPIDETVPGLFPFGRLLLHVSGSGFSFTALYDPVDGSLATGADLFASRVAWEPGNDDSPRAPEGSMAPAGLEIDLFLEPADDGGWTGRGYLRADGLFSPYDEMTGAPGAAEKHLGTLAGALIAGAEAAGFDPDRFTPERVATSFPLSVSAPEPDDRGRTRLVAGDPPGGMLALLHGDVRLYETSRIAPVILPCPLVQRVRLDLPDDGRIVTLPEPREVANAAGRFTLTVRRDGDRVTIERKISIGTPAIAAADWPLLRALLLEEADAANRTVILGGA
ncbi:MAG: DUF3857 domain-containing protein [Candidatus Krumholzibacteriota bacterium]|nr:DUF3857 domain-containing protein [Candidatus Krumholzibacteriota bacterium]